MAPPLLSHGGVAERWDSTAALRKSLQKALHTLGNTLQKALTTLKRSSKTLDALQPFSRRGVAERWGNTAALALLIFVRRPQDLGTCAVGLREPGPESSVRKERKQSETPPNRTPENTQHHYHYRKLPFLIRSDTKMPQPLKDLLLHLTFPNTYTPEALMYAINTT